MQIFKNKLSAATTALIALGTLSMVGCGWVDSTGTQSSPSTGTAQNTGSGAVVSVFGSDQLVDEGVVITNENTTARFAIASTPNNAQASSGWAWRSVERADAVSRCNTQVNFDGAVAETQLIEACTEASNCNFLIQEFANDGTAVFDITMPVLRAPVALSFVLDTQLESGELHSQEQTICAVAINEAPQIQQNTYRTLVNQTRQVSANDDDAIFSNDTDDDHVRNQPLFVKEVTRAPQFSADLSVTSDGGFLYAPLDNLSIESGQFLQDTFEIIVSDGVHDVPSVITLNIAASNAAPTQQQRVPNYTLTPTEQTPAELNADLSQFFNDSDNDPLQYQLRDDELSRAGMLSLEQNGTLTGSFGINDAGAYTLTVIVDDGLIQIEDRFTVTVQDTHVPNRAPTVTDIQNRRVTGAFEYTISRFFSDSDNDALEFSAANLPPNVSLSSDGVLTGTATNRNDGRWFISVTASDNRGGTVTDSFRLTINN